MLSLKYDHPYILDEQRGIQSVRNPADYLTFGPWIYLVPQYKPDSVLMLGYGGGTAVGLMQMFYGKDLPITAVDLADCSELNFYDIEIIQADAKEFVKTCDSYDTIVVDVFGNNIEHKPKGFVFTQEFADNLKKRANYIIIHALDNSDMSAYKDLRLVKTLELHEDRFYYYMVNRIARLPVR